MRFIFLLVLSTLTACSKTDFQIESPSETCSKVYPKNLAEMILCERVSTELQDTYYRPSCIRNGFFRAQKKRNGNWGILNKNGDVVVDFTLEQKPGFFNDGLAKFKEKNKYGFLNTKGKIAIIPQFDDAQAFTDGLAAVKINKKWGFIDTDGSIIVEPQFDEAQSFRNNLAKVTINKKKGYINTQGKLIIPLKYSSASGFRENRAEVRIDKLWGYIDTNDDLVINNDYDMTNPFIRGYAIVKKDKKYGIIDCEGKKYYLLNTSLSCLFLTLKSLKSSFSK